MENSWTEPGSPRQLDWFAVRVMSNCERRVATALSAMGFDVCLPLCRPASRRRRKNKETPIFRGYVFCCFDPTVLLPILMAPGVVHIVSCGRVPEAVDPVEMDAVRKLANSGLNSEPYPYIQAGQRVRVCDGPMEGVEGILVRGQGQDRIVISVSLLSRSVTVEVERTSIEIVSERVVRQNYRRSTVVGAPLLTVENATPSGENMLACGRR